MHDGIAAAKNRDRYANIQERLSQIYLSSFRFLREPRRADFLIRQAARFERSWGET